MGAGRTEVLEAIFGVFGRRAIRGTLALNGNRTRRGRRRRRSSGASALVARTARRRAWLLSNTVTFQRSLAALRRFRPVSEWTPGRAEGRRAAGDQPGSKLRVREHGGGQHQALRLAVLGDQRDAPLDASSGDRGGYGLPFSASVPRIAPAAKTPKIASSTSVRPAPSGRPARHLAGPYGQRHVVQATRPPADRRQRQAADGQPVGNRGDLGTLENLGDRPPTIIRISSAASVPAISGCRYSRRPRRT